MDGKSLCLGVAVGFGNFEAARQVTTAIIASRASLPISARISTNIIKQKEF